MDQRESRAIRVWEAPGNSRGEHICAAVGIIGGAFVVFQSGRGAPFLYPLGALASLAMVIAAAVQLGRVGRAGKERVATIDERGLVLDGRLRIAARRIARVYADPPNTMHAKWRVVIPSLPAVLLDCASEEDACALVDALGHGPSRRVGSFHLLSFTTTAGATALALVAGLVGLVSIVVSRTHFGALLRVLGLENATLVLVGTLFVVGAIRFFRSTVDVGLDGIRLRYSAYGRRKHGMNERFVPFAELETHRMPSGQVQVFQRGRHIDTWPAWSQGGVVLQRIAEARRPSAEAAEAAGTGTALGIAPALIAQPNADYRTAAYPKDLLLRVAEDAAQSATARAAAATALTDLDDDDRARVRVAALTTASPELREELGRVAAESDDVVARPLRRT